MPFFLSNTNNIKKTLLQSSVFDRETIDSYKAGSCYTFIKLYDVPKEVEKSCISILQKYISKNPQDKLTKSPAYIAFSEGRAWKHLDNKNIEYIKDISKDSEVSRKEKIKEINDVASFDRGFFNDKYIISKYGSKRSPEETRKRICSRAIGAEKEKDFESRVSFYSSLSQFAYCYEVAMNHDKELKKFWEIYKQRVYDLGKCVEAKDFIGCAKHNKMDWLIE